MRSRHLVVPLLAALVAAGGLAAAVPAQPAVAESCTLSMTPDLKTAKRHLFVATYEGTRRIGGGRRNHVFDVERVFAGGDRVQAGPAPNILSEGQTLELFRGGCSSMEQLKPGHRYLMSVSWLGDLTAWYGVAWELLPGGRVRLVREYDSARMDPRLAWPVTLRGAVSLMKPTESPRQGGLPDDQLTGDCPASPATLTPDPDPSAGPDPSAVPATGWMLALQATGGVRSGSPCSFDSVTAWSGGYLASVHAGERARARLVADWVSPDAVTWTQVTRDDASPFAQSGPTLAYGEGLIRFGSDEGDLAVWTSTDGTTWSRIPGAPALGTDAAWLDLRAAASGERLVVAGTNRDRCDILGCRERTWTWTSTDGSTWTRADPDGRRFPRPAFPIVGRGDGSGFVALGDDRAVLVSEDGIRWTVGGRLPDDLLLTGEFRAIPGDAAVSWITLRPMNDSFGGSAVVVFRSDDLRTWTESVASPGTDDWPPAIGTGPGGVVLAGIDRFQRPWVLLSPDGRTWPMQRLTPDLSLGEPVAAAIGPDGPVLVSDGRNLAGALAWRLAPEDPG